MSDGEIVMMCFKHNRYYRAGKCPVCIVENKKTDEDIFLLENENEAIDLTLWSGVRR